MRFLSHENEDAHFAQAFVRNDVLFYAAQHKLTSDGSSACEHILGICVVCAHDAHILALYRLRERERDSEEAARQRTARQLSLLDYARTCAPCCIQGVRSRKHSARPPILPVDAAAHTKTLTPDRLMRPVVLEWYLSSKFNGYMTAYVHVFRTLSVRGCVLKCQSVYGHFAGKGNGGFSDCVAISRTYLCRVEKIKVYRPLSC